MIFYTAWSSTDGPWSNKASVPLTVSDLERIEEMEVKIFTDVIDALERVGKAAVAIKNIPETQRKRISEAVEDSFTLLNSAINLVLLRLDDLLLEDSRSEFINDLKRLGNNQEWRELERDVRLCRKLRELHGEISSFAIKTIPLRVGSRDWANVRVLVDEILEGEGELADFIGRKLSNLSALAEQANLSNDGYKKTIASIKRVERRLRKDRQRLLASEISFIESVRKKG